MDPYYSRFEVVSLGLIALHGWVGLNRFDHGRCDCMLEMAYMYHDFVVSLCEGMWFGLRVWRPGFMVGSLMLRWILVIPDLWFLSFRLVDLLGWVESQRV